MLRFFDQVICAFKTHGKIIEVCRTSHGKSVKDLINCTKLPENTQICFIDDLMHPEMKHPNVVYIHIKHYKYNIPFETMILEYYNKINKKNKKFISNKKEFIEFMTKYTKQYDYDVAQKSHIEKRVDEILSKKIKEHLELFFQGKKMNNTTL